MEDDASFRAPTNDVVICSVVFMDTAKFIGDVESHQQTLMRTQEVNRVSSIKKRWRKGDFTPSHVMYVPEMVQYLRDALYAMGLNEMAKKAHKYISVVKRKETMEW